MAISLNNHESRIKALENGGSSSWSRGSNWAVDNKTGLILNWGRTSSSGISFAKPYSSATSYSISCGYEGAYTAPIWANLLQVTSFSASGCSIAGVNTMYIPAYRWLAIGYLISNRILKHIHACKHLLFTPLRKIGGVK